MYIISLKFFSFNLYKGSSFECGFSSFRSAGGSLSMPFLSITLLFLLFDVEILFIRFYPFIVFFGGSSWVILFILFVIIFTTLYE